MEDKSYVKYLIKKGVSGGAGFELETKLVKGDSADEIKEIGKQAIKMAEDLIQEMTR